jgi:hypothetical protein
MMERRAEINFNLFYSKKRKKKERKRKMRGCRKDPLLNRVA